MWYYFGKVMLSALIIVVISELAKRSSQLGGLVASLPLTSLLAFVWLFTNTKDLDKVQQLSISIFWMVIPSLALFILLPLLIKQGYGFWISLALGSLGTSLCYAIMLFVLKKQGIHI